MEICDRFLCKNRRNEQCFVPQNTVAFVCKHTKYPCPKARCEYCNRRDCENATKEH